MAVITTTALLLRHRDEREHDRLIVALTSDHGLLKIRARGTKRSAAKLAGSLEPLTEVQLSWAEGRNSGLVTGAVVQQRWPNLRTDLVASVSAQWLAELLEQIVRPGQSSQEIFEAARRAMTDLAGQTDWSLGRRWLALDRWAYQLLLLEGFVPAVDHCPRCSRPMPGDPTAYDPAVGFVHADEAAAPAVRLQPAVFTFLQTGQAEIPERQLFQQLHPMLESMIAHTIDQPLRSERVLRAVIRQARLSSDERYGMIDELYAKTTSQSPSP